MGRLGGGGRLEGVRGRGGEGKVREGGRLERGTRGALPAWGAPIGPFVGEVSPGQ